MSRAPFVTLNASTGLFEISEEAVRVLGSINAPLIVFALVGPYRTGKSSLLNMLLRLFGLLNRSGPDANGFSVGETTQACTRGIHMFTRPAASSDGLPILFVDTEGLNSTDRSAGANHDIQIFLLAALIASCLAYNSKGTIDERAISDLSIVGEMARLLHAPEPASVKRARPEAGGDAETDVADYMPELLWIVRDFSLRLVNASGQPYSAQQYMEEALAAREGAGDANELRRVIASTFPHRHCVTVRVPSAEEERVQQLNATAVTDLRIEFVQDVHQVLQHIKTRAKPKTVVDPLTGARAPLTGVSFLQYLRTIVQAVNEGAVPPLKSNYAMLSETQCASAAAAARNLVATALRNSSKMSSTSPESLLHEAIAVFNARSFGAHADTLRAQLEEELRSLIDDSYGAALRRALEEWARGCSHGSEEAPIALWRRQVAPVVPSHLQGTLELVVQTFATRDDALREAAESEISKAQAVRPQLDDLRRRFAEEMQQRRELQEQLNTKGLDLEASDRSLERERAKAARLESDLKDMREEATRANAAAANAITLRGDLDDRSAALERANRALLALDREFESLQQQQHACQAALSSSESEVARLRNVEERARRTELALNAARSELDELRASLSATEARASKAEEEGDRLRVDVVRARRERDDAVAASELSRVATESQSLSVQLEARQEEMRHMRSRLDAITRRCRELEEAKFELERTVNRSKR